MKFNKITPGTPAGQMPSFSASWQNAVSESAQAYQEQKRLGETGNGSKALRDTEHRVKCYNNTATPFLRGQSIELDGYRMTEVKPRHRWFNGTDYSSSEQWGIVLRDMDETGAAEVQMGGICTARVDVSDLNHTHANPTASSRNFESGDSGDLEFLSTPSSTGVQDVVVRFKPGQVLQDELRAEFSSYISAATSGNTYGLIVATNPVQLPTGTPSVTESPLYIADIHQIGGGLSSGDIVRAIRNTGIDSYGGSDVNWECNLDGQGAGGGGAPEVGCGLDYVSDVLVVDRVDLIGCGLKAGDGDCDIDVDTAALAGRGLKVDTDPNCALYASTGAGSDYCCISINDGCGITFSGDELIVDRNDLIGCGLKAGSGTCDIDVDLAALAGNGLTLGSSAGDCTGVPDFDGSCDCLQVNVGCGLKIVSDEVVVDNTDLAGPGLATYGTCGLQAQVDTTYIEINGSNEITLNLSGLCDWIKANCYVEVEVIDGCDSPFVTFDASGNPTWNFTTRKIWVLKDNGAGDGVSCSASGSETCAES